MSQMGRGGAYAHGNLYSTHGPLRYTKGYFILSANL